MPLIALTSHILEKPEPWKGKQLFGCWNIETEWISRAGGTPLMLPPNLSEEEVSKVSESIQGLMLVGGGDVAGEFYGLADRSLLERVYPERDRSEIALVKRVVAKKIPILAICRGTQVLNVALGGTLIPDIRTSLPASSLIHRPQDGPDNVHDVILQQGSALEKIFRRNTLRVNSYHHQAIKNLGKGLTITARTSDGIIEGVELIDYPLCIGVQWHPEVREGNREDMQPLFDAFVQAARQ
jgi:putative glutamine amidotransferase